MRYFRFLPMVFAGCLISALLYRFSLYSFERFYEATENSWIYTLGKLDYSFSTAFYGGLLDGFLHGTGIVTSLWCLHYLFLGSLLSYSILMLYGKIKNRIPIYVILCIFSYNASSFIKNRIFAVSFSSANLNDTVLICVFSLLSLPRNCFEM